MEDLHSYPAEHHPITTYSGPLMNARLSYDVKVNKAHAKEWLVAGNTRADPEGS